MDFSPSDSPERTEVLDYVFSTATRRGIAQPSNRMPCFINADLEITAQEDLSRIQDELGDAVVEVACFRQDDRSFYASFEINVDPEADSEQYDPELLILRFCDLIASFSSESRRMWDSAARRVIDLGFQSDDGRCVIRSVLSADALNRMSELGIELAFTIYPLEGKLGR